MIEISLDGLYTPGGDEDRNLADITISFDGKTYPWKMYIPANVDLSAYIESKKEEIKEEIELKEAQWEASPKTRLIEDTEIAIDKSEVVKPDVPDYYAKRRTTYPTLAEQLGAIWKGKDSSEYKAMISAIESIKASLQPPVVSLATLKEEKIKEIESRKEEARFANGSINGHTWQLDEKSQALLGQAILVASVGGPLPTAWIDSDNIPVPITNIQQLLDIASLAAAQTDQAYLKAFGLKSLVRSEVTDTKEKIDAITW